jgi:hypothetical protein
MVLLWVLVNSEVGFAKKKEEPTMRTRFITNLVLGAVAGFVVVASQAFAAGVTAWVTFGVAIGVLLALGAAQLDPRRALLQRALDGAVAVLAAWSVVASVVFAGATVTWLSFAEGLGFVAMAVAGLIAHETSTERVVHLLSIEGTDKEVPQKYAPAA